jgi:hypothetical protein
MHVELMPIELVKPYENNPRDITDKAIRAVKESIDQFGWRQPIVVDQDHVVIVGHTRLLAAQDLGLGEVPVHIAADMDPAQARAYRLADNKAGEFSLWDDLKLSDELAAVLDSGVDIDALGFVDSPLPDGFESTLSPDSGAGITDTTDDDVRRAQGGLESRHGEGSAQNLVDVICPHCGESYMLDPRALS